MPEVQLLAPVYQLSELLIVIACNKNKHKKNNSSIKTRYKEFRKMFGWMNGKISEKKYFELMSQVKEIRHYFECSDEY